MENEQEEDDHHGDLTSSDQQLHRLDLENKRLLQIDLDKDKKNCEKELKNKVQDEKGQSHTTRQQLKQELETLQREQQQKSLAAKQEAVEQVIEKYREKKMEYKNKIEALEQEHAKQQLTETMEIRIYETRLTEQQQQLATIQQQLRAARESANHSSQQVTELTEEKKRILDSYETKLAEEKSSMKEYEIEIAQLQLQNDPQQQTDEQLVSYLLLIQFAVQVPLVHSCAKGIW